MQLLAEHHILSGLKAGGFLEGNVEEMVKLRLGALFMPHGMRQSDVDLQLPGCSITQYTTVHALSLSAGKRSCSKVARCFRGCEVCWLVSCA